LITSCAAMCFFCFFFRFLESKLVVCCLSCLSGNPLASKSPVVVAVLFCRSQISRVFTLFLRNNTTYILVSSRYVPFSENVSGWRFRPVIYRKSAFRPFSRPASRLIELLADEEKFRSDDDGVGGGEEERGREGTIRFFNYWVCGGGG